MSKLKAERILEARLKKDMSPAEACYKLDISISALGNWEKGRHVPDANAINNMAKLYGVKLDYFYK